MNITNSHFQSIEKARDVLLNGDAFERLMMAYELSFMLDELQAKKERANKRTYEYIKERRKSNPDYGRPEREHRKK